MRFSGADERTVGGTPEEALRTQPGARKEILSGQMPDHGPDPLLYSLMNGVPMIEKKTPKSPRVVLKAASKFFKSVASKGSSKKKKQTEAAQDTLEKNGPQRLSASSSSTSSRENSQAKLPRHGGLGNRMAMNLEPVSKMHRSPRVTHSSAAHSKLSSQFYKELGNLLFIHAGKPGNNGRPYVPGEKGLPFVQAVISAELLRNPQLTGWNVDDRAKLVALIAALQNAQQRFDMTTWTAFRDAMLEHPEIQQQLTLKQQPLAKPAKQSTARSIVATNSSAQLAPHLSLSMTTSHSAAQTPRPTVGPIEQKSLESSAYEFFNKTSNGLVFSNSQIENGVRDILQKKQVQGSLSRPMIDDFIQYVLPAMVKDWKDRLIRQQPSEFQGLLHEVT
jgi:hypothetical protein